MEMPKPTTLLLTEAEADASVVTPGVEGKNYVEAYTDSKGKYHPGYWRKARNKKQKKQRKQPLAVLPPRDMEAERKNAHLQGKTVWVPETRYADGSLKRQGFWKKPSKVKAPASAEEARLRDAYENLQQIIRNQRSELSRLRESDMLLRQNVRTAEALAPDLVKQIEALKLEVKAGSEVIRKLIKEGEELQMEIKARDYTLSAMQKTLVLISSFRQEK
jgi:hypothetical protein